MTDEKKNTLPTHHAYFVQKGKDDKGFWTKIGAAWEHGDGKGFTALLDLVPTKGNEITFRKREEKNTDSE